MKRNSQGVGVKDGMVAPAGHAGHQADKLDAERAALRVSAAKALATETYAKMRGDGRRSDAEVAASAQSALQGISFLPPDRVKVVVKAGKATLTGHVEWKYQRQVACAAVRRLAGVTDVIDRIAIRRKLTVTAVKADIEAALTHRAKVAATKISVSIAGNEVTLTGTVQTWAEYDLAGGSTSKTRGACNVTNHIKVSY